MKINYYSLYPTFQHYQKILNKRKVEKTCESNNENNKF